MPLVKHIITGTVLSHPFLQVRKIHFEILAAVYVA
jgi:hypothetical protein